MDQLLKSYLSELCEQSKASEDKREVVHRCLANMIGVIQKGQTQADQAIEREQARLKRRLDKFNSEACNAQKELERRGWSKLTFQALLLIAKACSEKYSIKLDRDARRQRNVLMKWFDENLDKIRPLFDKVKFEYGEGNVIDKPVQ